MDRLPTSRHGNPLTLHVAVMFLFYVLSVTLCLSSFSTCVCVIFNPVGTFRTIANYLFYALSLSVLSTFLFAALIGVYFDDQTSPEPQRGTSIREKFQEGVPAPQGADDAAPVQEAHHDVSTTKEDVNAAPSRKGHREGPAPPQEVIQTTLTQDAYPNVSPTHDIALPSTVQPQTAPKDESSEPSLNTSNPTNETPHSREQTPPPPEPTSHDAAEPEKNPPEANPTEAAGLAKPAITTRASKQIQQWIRHIDSAATLDVDDDDNHPSSSSSSSSHPTTQPTKTTPPSPHDCTPLSPSATRSLSPDSEFQTALRAYLGAQGLRGGGGRRRLRRTSLDTAAARLGEESEFQGAVRKAFMLGKGKVGKARSA